MIDNHILQAKIYISARRISGFGSFNTCNGSMKIIYMSFLALVYDSCNFVSIVVSRFVSLLLSRFVLLVLNYRVFASVYNFLKMLRIDFVLNILFVAFVNVIGSARSLVADVYRVIICDVVERCLVVYILLGLARSYLKISARIILEDFGVYPQIFMNKSFRVGV